MRELINWGTPRRLQAEIEDKKHQFMERMTGGSFKKKKICKFTKAKDHEFKVFEEKTYKWFPRNGKATKIIEYRCGCGKKDLEFVEVNIVNI